MLYNMEKMEWLWNVETLSSTERQRNVQWNPVNRPKKNGRITGVGWNSWLWGRSIFLFNEHREST